jgi:DNA-binding Xre family transcriptional regulator
MTTVKEAVVARFQEILKEKNIKTNELANLSGVTPSSVYSMLDPRRKEVSVNLVKKLCDGLDMTLGQFFSAKVFDEIEQEIK